MKNKGNKNAIFQGFLFNVIFLSILSIVAVYYILPAYGEVAERKAELQELSTKYANLKTNGLEFGEFLSLHKSLGAQQNLDKNVFLSNVLKNFSKDDYGETFSNTEGGAYSEFLSDKIGEVQKQRLELEETGINESIKDILPYYTADSSLDEGSLTDFKFVNYIEFLLDTFSLTSQDKIGIGELSVLESFENKSKTDKKQDNPLDGKIYSSSLDLRITGKKRNIVNFLYYIENVGKIEIDEGKVAVKNVNEDTVIVDAEGNQKVNDFLDMGRYFIGEENMYNNLLMEVDRVSLQHYPDSSDFPTPEGYSLMKLVKESQGDEKYEISLRIKFYVKGLPIYKIEEFIKQMHTKHGQLLQVSKSGLQYVAKNKSKIKGTQTISAMNNLGKINRYLNQVQKEIDLIKKSLQRKENMGRIYEDSQDFDAVFNSIIKQLQSDMKVLSEPLYEKYKDILNS